MWLKMLTSKAGLSIIAITILSLAAYGGYKYVTHLQYTVAEQSEEITGLKKDLKDKETIIVKMKADYTAQNKLKKKLSRDKTALNSQLVELSKSFNKVRANGTKRDLGALALGKPKLVENIINAATRNVIRCAEMASGSVPLEGEKNSKCQHIVDSFKVAEQ